MAHDKGRQQRPAPSNRSGSPRSRPPNPKKGASSGGKSQKRNPRQGQGTSGSKARPAPSGKKRSYTATTRSVEAARRTETAKRRRDLKGAAVNLPNWVIEGLTRVTPRDRVAPALEALGAASEALGEGRYQAAVKHGARAKALSPQDPTTRETIGIAAYRIGDWKTALTELRAYRRMQGDTTHLPIEMDVLRAQNRPKDVEAAWRELQQRGGHGLVMNEGTIVYASFLLDQGKVDEAWKVIDPGKVKADPNEGHLRRYYVAARVAAARGDRSTARRLSDVIVTADPGFPGYEELEREIAAIPGD
jgi:hypothetical protein